ncbi:MAG: hypothetical protein DRN06_02410 [Thermoprotei archaeon]|nr:MAG: hypothetical protein DRN06_02410 [Thermoprotei archaeon]
MVEERNVVLITLDSVRADHCSFMGYHRKTTPSIDKMARKGLYFENAIATSVMTHASMISVLTGDYAPIRLEVTRPGPWRKVLSQRSTLPQILSKNGYSTGAFNPNPLVSSYFGFNKGFDYFQDFLSENFFDRIHYKILDRAVKSGGKGFVAVLRHVRNVIWREEMLKPWESYYESIIKWVERAEKPFFLWVFLVDTHHPFAAPRKYRKWGSFFDSWYVWYYFLKLYKEKWIMELPKAGRQKLLDMYDNSISYADAFVNRLWQDVKGEDPIFIIHADHGEAFGEHGFYGHIWYLYEELIHVPLVIYNADVKGRVEKPVSLLKLTPIILMLVDRKEDELYSLLENDSWAISEVLGDVRKVSVRLKDWKFITGQKKEDELYNLKEDPHEQNNLVEKHPKLVEGMRKIVINHISKHEMVHVKEKVKKLKLERIW